MSAFLHAKGSIRVMQRRRSGFATALLLSLLMIPSAHLAASQPLPSLVPSEGKGGENRAMSLALDAGGRPWALFEVDDGLDTNIEFSRWTGSDWQPQQPLSADPEAWEHSPGLAFAADGSAWAAWVVSPEPDESSIYVSRWGVDGWSRPSPVPGTGALDGRQPALATAPDGGVWLAWVGHDGTDREILVSHWDGSAWSAPRWVGTDDADPAAYDAHPRLAVGGTGQVWLAWVSHEGLLNSEIHASHWDGSSWSPQHRINTEDDTPDAGPSLALDLNGQPWVAWYGAAKEGDNRWRIYFSRWNSATSQWSGEQLVSSSPDMPVDELLPSLALDASGQLHAAWSISGSISGIAHTAWDGRSWTDIAWIETDEAAEAPVVLADQQAWLLWLTPDAAAGQGTPPVQQQRVEAVTQPLPYLALTGAVGPAAVSAYVPNRHLAHGDSITCGCYLDPSGEPAIPYPVILEERLDNSAGASEVINSGEPGEKARGARERLKDSLFTYQPEYLLIMEGTNDISSGFDPAATSYAVANLWRDARTLMPDIKVVVATMTPRLDFRNEEIDATNQEIKKKLAKDHVPCADQWQAFYDYGAFESFYLDVVHPGTTGLRIIANTFYQAMVDAGMLPSDSTPPTAQVSSLPAQSECMAVTVGWTGDDGGGSGVASFDVQVQDNGGPWSDWLLNTPNTSGTLAGAPYGHTLGFRVRARDQLGNLGVYSAAATTQITDSTPPESATILTLPDYQVAPFVVHWTGYDRCSQVSAFDVEYQVGTGSWVRWLTQASETEASLDPASPQCGQTYAFRVRAHDPAGNRSTWSVGSASTVLACHAVSGAVRTVRDTPIYNARVSAEPTGLDALPSDAAGNYAVYFGSPGSHDLAVERGGFGLLPAQKAVAVSGHVTGAHFYLPPLDDRVQNGGFESGDWGAWQPAGGKLPSLTATAHTGQGAALLDPDSGESRLSQSVSIPANSTQPTLSLMVRLAADSGPASKLKVQVVGTTTITKEWTVQDGPWVHVWSDLSSMAGQTVDVRLIVAGAPAVIVDEVSLGSALAGVYAVRLPLVTANHRAWR